MPNLPSSTAVRLAAYYSLAFTLLLLLLGAGLYLAIRRELGSELDQRILAERTAVIQEAASGGLAAVVSARMAHRTGEMRFALLDRASHMIAGQPVTPPAALGWSEFFPATAHPHIGVRGLSSRTPDGNILVVAADPGALEELDEHMVPLLAMTFALVAGIGVGGAFIFGRSLSRRLDAINRTAEAIIGGDLARRMPTTGTRDEFDRLSGTLNRMLDRIGELLANLRQVSGDLSHDLRTPLSRLRQTLELGLASVGGELQLRAAMSEALEQSEEALELFSGMLAVAELEGGGVRRHSLDLSQLTADLVEGYTPSLEDAGRTFAVGIAPGVIVEGNRELLAQLVSNLLENALRHTAPGVDVGVSLHTLGAKAYLTVADHGPGIAPEDRERVFARFVRLERSRTTPGHGLGLSMVAAVAHAHGGAVRIEDNHPGARMIVTLPRSPS